jgi:hypothetical protein
MIIQVVTNSDRCHVSIDGTPAATFMFSSLGKTEALRSAKAEAFDLLNEALDLTPNVRLDTEIINL